MISCSSSILDKADGDEYADDDDFEDGINVTLVSSPTNVLSKKADKVEDVEQRTACNEKKPIKRLNGAAKKRLKYLLAKGHTLEEARVLAEKPYRTPYTDQGKRRRNVDPNGSNNSDSNPRKKVARQVEKGHPVKSSVQDRLNKSRDCSNQTSSPAGTSGLNATTDSHNRNKPSFRDALESARIGIVPYDYPNVELTTEQMIAVQKAILKDVALQRKHKIKPKFGNCMFRLGHMIITCKNQETVKWLKAIVPKIRPWDNACLKAVDEINLPRPEILLGFFPLSADDSTDEILALIESQNEGLVVDAWRILKRYTVKQQHTELVFTADATSMKTLKDCKFTIDYKFGSAFIRKKSNTQKENDDEEQTTNPDTFEGSSRMDTDESEPNEHHGEASDAKDREIVQASDAPDDVEMGSCNPEMSKPRTSEGYGERQSSDHENFLFEGIQNPPNNNGQKSSEYREIDVHANMYKETGERNARVKERKMPSKIE